MPHSVSPIAALSSTNLTSQAPGNNESSRNDTKSIFGHQEILSVTMIVLLAIICLLIILVNGLVVFLICRNRTLKSVTNMFLTSLALSDLISGLVGFPLFVSCLRSGVLNVCVSSTIFFRFIAISSVCHVLLVATDRYVAIVHPLQHDSVVTRWRAIGATTFVWIFAFSSSVVQLSWFGLDENSLFDFEATEDLNLTYSKTCIVLFFAFPLILMCCIYGRIFYISYKLTKSDRELTDVWKVQESRSVLYEWRGRSVLLIMMVIFEGCWLPFFLAMIDDHMNPTESSPPIWVQRLLVVLNFIPPLFNPLLCTLAKKDFRKALLGVIYKSNELRLNLEWRSTATGSV